MMKELINLSQHNKYFPLHPNSVATRTWKTEEWQLNVASHLSGRDPHRLQDLKAAISFCSF